MCHNLPYGLEGGVAPASECTKMLMFPNNGLHNVSPVGLERYLGLSRLSTVNLRS